ncbi:hypothetical protein AMTR_s00048p00035730, partial [Amborella trichopoda]
AKIREMLIRFGRLTYPRHLHRCHKTPPTAVHLTPLPSHVPSPASQPFTTKIPASAIHGGSPSWPPISAVTKSLSKSQATNSAMAELRARHALQEQTQLEKTLRYSWKSSLWIVAGQKLNLGFNLAPFPLEKGLKTKWLLVFRCQDLKEDIKEFDCCLVDYYNALGAPCSVIIEKIKAILNLWAPIQAVCEETNSLSSDLGANNSLRDISKQQKSFYIQYLYCISELVV